MVKDTKILENGNIQITTDKNQEVVFTIQELKQIMDDYDEAVYFREDVTLEIDNRIKNGELPEEASKNEKFINAVTASYAYKRREYCDDSDESWTWQECINEAFDEVTENYYGNDKDK